MHSYIMLLDLNVMLLSWTLSTISKHPLENRDDHSPLLLAHIESILMGILDEANDLLLEFLISILSQSQVKGSPSSIAHIMSKRLLETCASWILLQQISLWVELCIARRRKIKKFKMILI